ncbi:MAG: alpha-amylase [Sphingomonadales bacterium]|nr:alpha-amylase [Sphingomonadales bacterium]MDE2169147.1 alpha-amylase [Sphingomonadales bacterium]
MPDRTLVQFFHWYSPGDGHLWQEVAEKARSLAEMGLTDVWLPPAYKGANGGLSVDYDTYDLFDLGEFDQKGSVATKYGTRAAFGQGCAALREAGLRVLHDVVFDHKMGADETERVHVRRANPENRTEIEEEAFEATAHTRFTFPGRGGKHSQFIWDVRCFSGVDCIEDPDETGVFRLVNDHGDGEWNDEVAQEFGNFDYLMGANVELRNRAVYEELKYWGRWMADQVATDGFRLDAAKHIPAWFFRDWVGHMRQALGEDLFVVAEYWDPDVAIMQRYLELVDHQVSLFDAPLHFRFHEAARAGGDYDLRNIFTGTLVAADPDHAVTIVGNHDTQPLQALEAPVEPWFKPLAYALILLREGGVPCVFYPDLYGAHYRDTGGDGQEHDIDLPAVACLPALIAARHRYAHGAQTDLFDDAHTIGFIRHGTQDQPGCVVVMTNGDESSIVVELGPDHGSAVFRDVLGHCEREPRADEQGRVTLPVKAGSVSVWVRAETK